MSVIRVFEAFSGVGAQRMALRNIGVDHEVVGISEIDKFAIRSYDAIHGNTANFGDISKINPKTLPDFDLFTYSFPCQDLSVAGKRQGMVKEVTRSGLLYECEKVIETKLPKYLLLENVKNLVSKRFKPQFDEWLSYLEDLGYTNYWQVLNAKDYGVPQNRERVFVVSILNDEEKKYVFPQKQPLDVRLRDLLEDKVEEKYYINRDWHFTQSHEQKHDNNEIAQIDGISYKATRSVGDVNKLCRTIDTMGGGQREPKILVEENRDQIKFIIGSTQKNAFIGDGSFSPTLTCAMGTGGGHVPMIGLDNKLSEHLTEMLGKFKESNNIQGYRIRKLTPKECWRLMGFSDSDFFKAKAAGLSDTQLYKQAGNSIVVPVLEGIFSELFK